MQNEIEAALFAQALSFQRAEDAILMATKAIRGLPTMTTTSSAFMVKRGDLIDGVRSLAKSSLWPVDQREPIIGLTPYLFNGLSGKGLVFIHLPYNLAALELMNDDTKIPIALWTMGCSVNPMISSLLKPDATVYPVGLIDAFTNPILSRQVQAVFTNKESQILYKVQDTIASTCFIGSTVHREKINDIIREELTSPEFDQFILHDSSKDFWYAKTGEIHVTVAPLKYEEHGSGSVVLSYRAAAIAPNYARLTESELRRVTEDRKSVV